MSKRKKFDVFLSHSSIDNTWVIHLKNALESQGISVWLDRDEIRPGNLFVDALEAGLEESHAVALIVSPDAIASGWVKEEYSRALSLTHTKSQPLQLIPVILREAELPGFLANRSWVDFRDESTFEKNLKRLIWGITNKKQARFHSKPLLERNEKQNHTEISRSIKHFTQKLDDFINQIPELQSELQFTLNCFGKSIQQPDCKAAHKRFTNTCSLVYNFDIFLSKSIDLPLEVVPQRLGLMNSLIDFKALAKATEENISIFCDLYGTVLDQPITKRSEIQKQLNNLLQYCKFLSDEAYKLQSALIG